MSKYSYITNRTLEDAGGNEKGRLRVLVPTGSTEADVAYECPMCGESKELKMPWKRPFSVRCQKCSHLMKVPKLKGKK